MTQQLTGEVVANSLPKTVTVLVRRQKRHPLYGKQYQVSKKYLVHTDSAGLAIGDVVQIEPSRPRSRRKHWQVVAGPPAKGSA